MVFSVSSRVLVDRRLNRSRAHGSEGRRDGPRTISGTLNERFERFVTLYEPRLRRALVTRFGTEEGRDATAEALAYAWEHWTTLETIDNPLGYLYRVGQSRSRKRELRVVFLLPETNEHEFEPKLPEHCGNYPITNALPLSSCTPTAGALQRSPSYSA